MRVLLRLMSASERHDSAGTVIQLIDQFFDQGPPGVLRPRDRAHATTDPQAHESLLIDWAVIARSYNCNMLAFDLPEPADGTATADGA